MTDFQRGPVDRYEIVWRSGHIETVLAHQVSWPQNGMYAFGGRVVMLTEHQGPAQVHFHAEIDGKWKLTLVADEADIQTIRLLTADETLPAVES